MKAESSVSPAGWLVSSVWQDTAQMGQGQKPKHKKFTLLPRAPRLPGDIASIKRSLDNQA
jgi:hypothetical protein